MDTLFELLFQLIGGLGIFLLGMKSMSDGMQAVAGSSLRRMIALVTNNRVAATIVGVFVTCVVQSSSITTVMVVGFVNSGVMALNERRRYTAMAFMGVGMVFFGLELMKDACSIIKQMPEFEEWFSFFNADTYLGVLKCALVGCVMTTLVQSSSATLGITISLAFEGVISYETAAALVLGENIGTTITALFASLGATTNARRAAYFHVIFNMLGVLWITAIFGWYVKFIPQFFGYEVLQAEVVDGNTTYPGTTAAIAATNSVFNVINTLIFLPFVPFFVTFLNKLVPAKDYKEKPRLTDLDIRMLETPLLAIEQSQKEIEKMGDGCSKMLSWLAELRGDKNPDTKLADRLKTREEILDHMQDEIAEFVTKLLSGNVPHSVAAEARRQIRVADEFESISDYIYDLDKFDRKLRKTGNRFTEQQLEALSFLQNQTNEYLQSINEGLVQANRNTITQTESIAERIREQIKSARKQHLEELSDGAIAPVVSVAFLASLNAFSRVRDHAYNVAETISGEK